MNHDTLAVCVVAGSWYQVRPRAWGGQKSYRAPCRELSRCFSVKYPNFVLNLFETLAFPRKLYIARPASRLQSHHAQIFKTHNAASGSARGAQREPAGLPPCLPARRRRKRKKVIYNTSKPVDHKCIFHSVMQQSLQRSSFSIAKPRRPTERTNAFDGCRALFI